jgi:acyl-CoA hydrolase
MNKKEKKSVEESLVIKNELLLPNDTNPLNNLMGGRLMHWMDIAAGISAQRHSNSMIVTASVDNISFAKPIELGSVVTLKAQVTRAFNTSMEVYIDVWAEHIPSKTRFKSNSAFFTFVAVDGSGKPVPVPEAVPNTEEEKKLYEGALRRRQLRLILAGRMKPGDAHELKSIFET